MKKILSYITKTVFPVVPYIVLGILIIMPAVVCITIFVGFLLLIKFLSCRLFHNHESRVESFSSIESMYNFEIKYFCIFCGTELDDSGGEKNVDAFA